MVNWEEKVKIKTLIIGKLNKGGFTLIELMLVILVLGIILFLTVPTLRHVLLADNLKKAARQLIGLEKKLRSDALRDQIDYILHLDLSNSNYWVTSSDMTPEGQEEKKKNVQHLASGVSVLDIIGENNQKQTEGIVKIKFQKNNVSMPAVIHLFAEGKNMTLVINPFLGVSDIYDKYVDISGEGQEGSFAR